MFVAVRKQLVLGSQPKSIFSWISWSHACSEILYRILGVFDGVKNMGCLHVCILFHLQVVNIWMHFTPLVGDDNVHRRRREIGYARLNYVWPIAIGLASLWETMVCVTVFTLVHLPWCEVVDQATLKCIWNGPFGVALENMFTMAWNNIFIARSTCGVVYFHLVWKYWTAMLSPDWYTAIVYFQLVWNYSAINLSLNRYTAIAYFQLVWKKRDRLGDLSVKLVFGKKILRITWLSGRKQFRENFIPHRRHHFLYDFHRTR